MTLVQKKEKTRQGGFWIVRKSLPLAFKERSEARKDIPGVTCHRDRDLSLQRLKRTFEIQLRCLHIHVARHPQPFNVEGRDQWHGLLWPLFGGGTERLPRGRAESRRRHWRRGSRHAAGRRIAGTHTAGRGACRGGAGPGAAMGKAAFGKKGKKRHFLLPHIHQHSRSCFDCHGPQRQ